MQETPKYKAYSLNNFRDIPQVAGLSEQQRFEIEVVGHVLPFKVNNYVVDRLIDWNKVPDDPIYALKGKSVVKLDAYSDIAVWPKDRTAYLKLKEQKVDELIVLASNVIPELRDPKNIIIKEGYTPKTIEDYTKNKGGVVYGFEMTPEQWEKIPNTTPVKNVFIASNWTQAWHGVCAGQVNGWRAARLILDKEGIE